MRTFLIVTNNLCMCTCMLSQNKKLKYFSFYGKNRKDFYKFLIFFQQIINFQLLFR